MCEGATWLCERVLPAVPLRQFVLSLPRALRYLLAYDGKLCRAVAKAAMQEIFRFQRMQARKALGISSTRQAHTGAIVAVQRFGSAGAKPVRLQDGRPRVPPEMERAGKALGFVLDAQVRVSANNRLHRERLCRYLLRPPLAKGRLHEILDGKYAFELKTPWSDGTRVIFFSGEEFVARLTALVPPPRMHMVHYFGVLAPNATLRKFVVPEAPAEEDTDPCGHSIAYEQLTTGKTIRRRWIPWATMLMKVFAVDVLACPKCDSRMQRIAWITQPRIIHAILDCFEAMPQPP